MTTVLIVLACITGYTVIGAAYARSRAVAVYRKAKAEWSSESIVRESVNLMLLWRVLAWPYAMVFDAVAATLGGWMQAPIQSRRDEAHQLRVEAGRYDDLIRACTDPEERRLMQAGRDALLAQAREMDL